MKYLVNRETKEHKVYSGMEFYDDEAWRVVEADDEGWIKWTGSGCPLPDGTSYESLCYRKNDVRCLNKAPRGCWEYIPALKDSCIKAYRPIIPAESKPTLEETWHKIKQEAQIDVFTRLSEAVAASESIPALIAEINSMLPEGYEVREKAKPEAVTEDMSDCSEVKGFRVGDSVECVDDDDSSGFLTKGLVYEVVGFQNGEINFNKNGPSWMTSRFKHYSRGLNK